jgi:hypothetical protein
VIGPEAESVNLTLGRRRRRGPDRRRRMSFAGFALITLWAMFAPFVVLAVATIATKEAKSHAGRRIRRRRIAIRAITVSIGCLWDTAIAAQSTVANAGSA